MKNQKTDSCNILIVIFLTFVIGSNAFGATTKDVSADRSTMHKAYRLSDEGKNTAALKLLNILNSKKKKSVSNEEINLLRGRIYFNNGKHSESLEAYEKIKRNSDQWIPSVEERGWAKVFVGKTNEAIADSHTLMSPLFNDVVSPEAYFFSAYVAHQTCDFIRVFKIVEQFKKIAGTKIVSIEQGLQTSREPKKQWELKHYSDVISKMHLIEADVIQRIYMDSSLKGKRSDIGQEFKASNYDLQFPYDAEDVWIDEIDKLKVNAKNCPTPFSEVVSL